MGWGGGRGAGAGPTMRVAWSRLAAALGALRAGSRRAARCGVRACAAAHPWPLQLHLGGSPPSCTKPWGRRRGPRMRRLCLPAPRRAQSLPRARLHMPRRAPPCLSSHPRVTMQALRCASWPPARRGMPPWPGRPSPSCAAHRCTLLWVSAALPAGGGRRCQRWRAHAPARGLCPYVASLPTGPRAAHPHPRPAHLPTRPPVGCLPPLRSC